MASGPKLVDKDRGWKEFVRRTKQAVAEQGVVKIGVLDASPRRTELEHEVHVASRRDAKARGLSAPRVAAGTGASNVEIAAHHEFGAPAAGIPERSFLRATMDRNFERYQWLLRRLAESVVRGKMTVENGLNLIGAKVASDVRKRISEGIPPALKRRTRERKGSKKPLIDTGQLRASITHAYVKGGP